MKSEGERDRYIQLNAEFQRIARRDKKAFFKEQCSITEKNNKKGKTRDLFRKTGNIKGIFNPKMGTIKDKNGKDLVDADSPLSLKLNQSRILWSLLPYYVLCLPFICGKL